ncbi:MAG: TraR/DksA C4-type zinc finger protein [Candidatus Pacebacteria bacterium]|nr:TraR/DksA C4-type zinc finger protein [Candidatus Paceibacterota bacterium]
MDKKIVLDLQKKLEKEKAGLEEQLKKFATKDEKLSGDWDTKYPRLDGNESGSGSLEIAADEVEQYGSLLPVEHSLEIRLKNVNLALEKIKKGNYGICEKCKKEIPSDRLKVSPESRFCIKCGK